MADNGISTLATKQLKQEAKLALAQTKRQDITPEGYRVLNGLNKALLPAPYLVNIADSTNPHIGGLVVGRPWHT